MWVKFQRTHVLIEKTSLIRREMRIHGYIKNAENSPNVCHDNYINHVSSTHYAPSHHTI